MRVDDGIEGLVHISELAERHVELPEQVVTVGNEIFVKVIDIDLERRRISLSLKQANDESAPVAEFDPTLYGMAAEYDEQGNYKYPEGFDPETNEWLEGFDAQREKWEKQYAEAHARWEAHKAQVEAATKADAEAAAGAGVDLVLLGLGCRLRRRGRRRRAPRPPKAPSPPTRHWPLCARSSPATDASPARRYAARPGPRKGPGLRRPGAAPSPRV